MTIGLSKQGQFAPFFFIYPKNNIYLGRNIVNGHVTEDPENR